MSDLSIIPLEDGFETQLAQDWNGAVGTVYVLDTPSYTPTNTPTYIVVNPGKTNMQIATINAYDSTANTLTVSDVTLLKGIGINSTAPASSHATGSQVIISDNYQFWADIQTAINSKLDKNGNNGVTYATTAARDSALGADGVATLPYRNIYVTATGLFYNYNLSANAWQSIDTGTSPANATASVSGLVRTDVAPAGIPVALIQDNPKYDALAGTSGTPSASNKYVTADDVATTATADKVARRLAGGNITVVTETTGDNTTNAASTAFVQQELTANIPTIDYTVNTNTDVTYSNWQVPAISNYWALTSYTLGTLTPGYGIFSGSGAGSAYTRLPGTGANDFYIPSSNKELRVKFPLRISTNGGNNEGFGFCLQSAPANIYAGTTDTSDGSIRFLINGTDLWACNSNGTNYTATQLSTLTYTNKFLLGIVFTPGVDIKFYVNGVLTATHTQYLPSGSSELVFALGASGGIRDYILGTPTFSLQS